MLLFTLGHANLRGGGATVWGKLNYESSVRRNECTQIFHKFELRLYDVFSILNRHVLWLIVSIISCKKGNQSLAAVKNQSLTIFPPLQNQSLKGFIYCTVRNEKKMIET